MVRAQEEVRDEAAPEVVDRDADRIAYQSSPREFLDYFLSAASAGDWAAAARVFAPGGLTALDLEDHAEWLYELLNKVGIIDVTDYPGEHSPEARKSTWEFRATAEADESKRLVLRLERAADRGWFVPVSTRDQIANLAAEWYDIRPAAKYLVRLGPLERLRYEIRERAPAWMRSRVFLIENWQWVGILVLLFVAVVLDWLTRRLAGYVVRRAASSERIPLPGEELVNFERPLGILVAALAYQWMVALLGLQHSYAYVLDFAASTAAVVAGIWAAYRLIDVVCGLLAERARETDNKFDDVLVPLLRRTLKILLTIVALFFLASKWSQDVWSIVAGLSIGSLAVGFAARDSIENLFGTFTVLLDKPFQLGDWITVGEIDGTVEHVGFRSTRVRTFYNSLISVPNRTFISATVDNWGARKYRRIKTMLSLTYDTPPEKIEAFCEGVRELIRNHPYTRKDYFHVYLNQFSGSSLEVLLYCFVRTPDWATELRERHRLFSDILSLAGELSVSFAFPTQTLHMARPEDLVHADVPSAEAAPERGRRAASKIAPPTDGALPPPVGFP